MDKSNDKKVQDFLDGMVELDFAKSQILQAARAIVFEKAPTVEERFIYGGIMFCCDGTDFGGVFASKKHVSFEFNQGFQFTDPQKHLEGGGKFRRHLKLETLEDVERKDVSGFVTQAVG